MFGNKSGPSMVFEYGCRPPVSGGDLLDGQIRLAHRYRNKLAEIELGRRSRVRAEFARIPEVAAIQSEIDALDARLEETLQSLRSTRQRERRRIVAGESAQSVAELKAGLSVARTRLKAAKKEALQSLDLAATLKQIDAEAAAAVKQARAESGLYWGTYLAVEQGFDRARKSSHDPRFRPFDGGGRVAIQCQGGLDAGKIFGSDSRIQIDPIPEDLWRSPIRGERRRASRTMARIRTGSQDRQPVWVEFPVTMHRPLPENSRVKWVYLVREQVGTKFRHKLQFVVELAESRISPSVATGAVGIDLGWRLVTSGLRVAYWADSAGQSGELVLPESLLARRAKIEDLQSIRDKNFDEIRDWLSAWLSGRETPDWLRDKTQTLVQWRSAGRLASVVIAWRNARFPGDEEAFTRLESWRKQDKHLLEWQANQRAKLWRQRREIYRLFGSWVAANYGAVVMEEFDLRRVARKKPAEDNSPDNETARANRAFAAVSILRSAVDQACAKHGVLTQKTSAQFTTKACSACGKIDNFDAGRWVVHRCSACGTSFDQDENAARNLLRAAMSSADAGQCSKPA